MSLFRRIISYGGIIAALVLATTGPVSATSNAYGSKFITSMTYMNVGTGVANLSVKFVDEAGTAINYPLTNSDGSARTLARNASASLSVSVLPATLGATSSWISGAVINANQPLVTTMVQVSTNPTIRVRPVSNGFTASDAGSTVILPYIAKACGTNKLTTRFTVQNIGSATEDITITLYWPNGDVAYTQTDSSIAVGQIVSVDMGSVTVTAPTSSGYSIPNGCAFEGSALLSITGVSKIVATAFESSTTGREAATYESLKSPGDNKVFMPSALCNVNYGDGAQSSSYVVHNSNTSSPTVSITYKYQIRASNGSLGRVLTKVSRKGSLSPNKSLTINACDDIPNASVGSATISTANASHTITAISKISGNGVYAIAPGIPEGDAAVDVYAPYVRYSTRCFTATPTTAVCRNESRQRTLFSIQNTSASTNIRVRITLFNHLGVAIGNRISGVIEPGAKVSMSPADVSAVSNTATSNANNEFGYWVVAGNIVYGGSARIQAWQVSTNAAETSVPIAVTVRVLNSTSIGQTAEDYNAIVR